MLERTEMILNLVAHSEQHIIRNRFYWFLCAEKKVLCADGVGVLIKMHLVSSGARRWIDELLQTGRSEAKSRCEPKKGARKANENSLSTGGDHKFSN